jgi:23S rRNA (cytidine1920-2'-O)/16S rRNA (cytidine1409-2'-O)-methyltransferase
VPDQRLDLALVDRGIVPSRSAAARAVAEGRVLLNGVPAMRPATPVRGEDLLEVTGHAWVGRGALKLEAALDAFDVPVEGRLALDLGASTGGFTQVLLERGCDQVIAVDVGSDQLTASLRSDPRVQVHERTNLRDLGLHHVGGVPVDLVVADVSFISLTLLIGPLVGVAKDDGWLLLLIKPQFEVGRELLGKDGVVRTPAHQMQAIDNVISSADEHDWHCVTATPSRLPGVAGNREFFILLRRTKFAADLDLAALVQP